MIIKLVNPLNKDEVCVYGTVAAYRISTKGSTPLDINKFIDDHRNATDFFINPVPVDIDCSKKLIRRIFFRLDVIDTTWLEVFTNWKIYLMGDDGKTIESL